MSITLDLSNGATILSIADIALTRGSQVVTFLEQIRGSEQTVARLQAEVLPLREILRRLRDKLQSSSASNMPFRNEIALACWNAQRTLEELQKDIESWVGEDGKPSIGGSVKIASRHEKIEAMMAQLGNWRSTLELAMAASILVQSERQAAEIAHLTKMVTELFQSAEEQRNAMKLKDAVSTDLKNEIEQQKQSAEALLKLCNNVKGELGAVQATFGKIELTDRAVQYTGIVEAPAKSVRHDYEGISAGGDTFSAHSVIGSGDLLERLARLHYQNSSGRP